MMAQLFRKSKVLFIFVTFILLFHCVFCMEAAKKPLTPSDLDKENRQQGSNVVSSKSSKGTVGKNPNPSPSFPITDNSGQVNPRLNQPIPTVSQDLRNRVTTLSTEFDNFSRELDRLQTALREEVTRRQNTLQNVNQRIDQLENNRRNQQTTVVGRPSAESRALVAFSGSVNRVLNQTGDFDVLPFGFALTHLGNPYSHATGKFRCPVKGLYHFWMTIAASPNEKLVTEILVNGVRRSLNHAGGRWFGGVGTSVVNLVLNAGDTVWARNVNSRVFKTELWWSIFNGYLVKQIA